MPLTTEQKDWKARASMAAGFLPFTEEIFTDYTGGLVQPGEDPLFDSVKPEPNPCVRLFGKGPEGVTCRHCEHLIRTGHASKGYLKCEFRTFTRGPGSDHKAGWESCAKFQEGT